jgi:hypothetical protein
METLDRAAAHRRYAAAHPDGTKHDTAWAKELVMHARELREHNQRHETNEHKQMDLWQQTIQAGRAVQQAAEAQKAPTQTKQADTQREL